MSRTARIVVSSLMAAQLAVCPGRALGDTPPAAARAVTPPASAAPAPTVVRDGDAYSFGIPARAGACVLFPATLFDAAACPSQAKPLTTAPDMPEDVRLLAVGILRIDDPGHEHQAVLLTASLDKMRHSLEPDEASAASFAAGMRDEAKESAPGTTVHSGSESVRLASIHGVRLARIAFDLDGATGTYARLQHTIAIVGWSSAGAYAITLNCTRADAPAADALADEIAKSVRVAAPAPPRSK
jgi:hypothetical protein